MPDSTFAADFRDLLTKHGITHPKFAHGSAPFDPAKPRVLYSGPVFDQDEMVAATVALCEGRWAVNGEFTNRFEKAFSKVVNQAETVAVNSGSSADLLAIAAAKKRFGWNDGDGVIVSPCGFPTTISALILNNLVPVFVDIEWETLNADNTAIEAALKDHNGGESKLKGIYFGPRVEPKVRAIFVSPVLGNPPDMDRLTNLAKKYDAVLIGDLCDALGGLWRGKPLSEYFVVSTGSAYPAHHYSTLNGGTISSNDSELITIARSMSQWGRGCRCSSTGNLLPNGVCGKRFSKWLPNVDCDLDHRYVYDNIGWNVQQLDICAAIGIEQLKKLDGFHQKRREAWNRIKGIITASGLSVRVVKKTSDLSQPSWFGLGIVMDDPDLKRRLVAHLESRNVQTRSYFAGNLLAHAPYAHLGNADDDPNANQVLCKVFWLGVAPFYTEDHFTHIEKALKEFAP